MSIITPPFRTLQQFFRSGPMPCPYLPGRVERKLFTRLSGPYAAEMNAGMARAGFRRSHDIVYRPVCPGCSACVPVRVPVADFAGSRTQRRLIRRNGDLTLSAAPARATVEQYRIFQAYQAARHRDSDMRRMGLADFAGMVNENRVDSVLYEARDGAGRLHACLLADRLDDGLSAVYSFFDPASPRQSLGTWLILALIAEARRLGLPHVYLGYWIADSRKMAYKGRFQPLEALGHDGWVRIAPPPPDPAVMVDPVPDWTEPDDYPDLFELEREITD